MAGDVNGGGPAAGWYRDPGGSGGRRYWDGQRWTEHVAPPDAPDGSAPASAGEPGAPPGIDPAEVAGPPQRGGSRRLLLGITSLVVLVGLVVGGVLLSGLVRRGASSPMAAAEGLVAAIVTDDLGAAARLLPPDEVDWFRGLLRHLPDGAGSPDGWQLGLDLDVTFAAPVAVTDDLQLVPIESVSFAARDDVLIAAALMDQFGLVLGERYTERLAGEPCAGVVAVRRGGSWFVSPLGSVLECWMREAGLGGAAPAEPRRGAADPDALVEEVIGATIGVMGDGGSVLELLDLLDPDELQVLDNYRRPIRAGGGGSGTAWRPTVVATTRSDGSLHTVERLDITAWDERVVLDLVSLCADVDSGRDCLRDTDPSEWVEPWFGSTVRAVLEPDVARLRLRSVERDGRHYVSIGGSLEHTLEPVLDRLGDHGIAGILAPESSPHAQRVLAADGDVVTVELVDGWNAIVLEPAGQLDLHACPVPPGVDPYDWYVDGHRVVTDWRPTLVDRASGRWAGGVLLVGTSGATSVSSIDVRLANSC